MTITVKEVSDRIYIRQPHTATHDIIRKVEVTESSSTASGATDFNGTVTCLASATADPDVLYASPVATLNDTLDNAPPLKINGAFLGGNHTIPARVLTNVGHGLSNTDVGDVGTDGAAKVWVIVEIVDADNIRVTPQNTTTATEWTIAGSVTGSTITFTGAGAYTFTADSIYPLPYPFNQDYERYFVMDGAVVTDLSTAQTCSSFEVRENYNIPNVASILTDLIANKPDATPLPINDPSIQTQIQLVIAWRFDVFGGRTSEYTIYNEQDYALRNFDYFGAMQSNRSRASDGGFSKMLLYIPDVGEVDGYSFTDIEDVTSNPATVIVEVSDCDDATNPASHFAEILTTAADVVEFGHVIGYRRNVGVGIPATRASLCNRIFDLSPSSKLYPAAISDGVQPAGGETHQVVTYDAFYDMVDNPEYTINKCVEFADGKVHWIFDCHATLSSEWIALPSSLVGRSVRVLDESSSFTLHNHVIGSSGLQVSVSGGYGHAVIEVNLMNETTLWKGAVEQAETGANGNISSAWKGAVEPLADGVDELTATSVESTSELSVPAAAEVAASIDALLAVSIQSASEVSSPSVDGFGLAKRVSLTGSLGAPIPYQSFSIIAGQYMEISIGVVDENGDVADLTGASSRFAMARTTNGSAIVDSDTASATLTMTDPANGAITVEIGNNITDPLLGDYYYENRVTDLQGREVVTTRGWMTLESSIT